MLINEILRQTALGKSPVKGEKFEKLNEKYADREHKGDRTPRLRLEGDLMASLGFEQTTRGLTVGIMDDKEQKKADGHNNFSGESKLPQRRFIPGTNQDFTETIQAKISKILDAHKQPSRSEPTYQDQGLKVQTGVISDDELFGTSTLDDYLGDLFG